MPLLFGSSVLLRNEEERSGELFSLGTRRPLSPAGAGERVKSAAGEKFTESPEATRSAS